ncbi:MAG: hypothetical protein AB7J40_00405 [Candidatus Altimarinota bacterium]
MFKLWSQLNKKAYTELRPDLGLRMWSNLSELEKYNIWKHLESYFFDKDIQSKKDFMGRVENYFYDFGSDTFDAEHKKKRVYFTIFRINEMYKANNYTPNFLEDKTYNAACADFYNLFTRGAENIALELISIYADMILFERREQIGFEKKEEESDEKYIERLEEWRWETFDSFTSRLNEIFDHFCLNLHLKRIGYVPKQEEIIEEEVYNPVLKKLSHKKWSEVNRDLSDAFEDFRGKDYSGSITHVISSVQAYLQISINGKTGQGEISKLIPEAKKKGIIPSDDFSTIFYDKLESYLMRTRQEKGDPHPKKEYANEKNARLVLNLAMIFFEHSL